MARIIQNRFVILENNQYSKAKNNAGSADVDLFKLNASDIIEFSSFPEKSGTPTTANQLVNKSYVDGVAQGLDPKGAVRAATLVAGTLASSFEDGDIIDGVTLATGDRILIKNNSTASENGIYTVNASGAPTRASDMDASNEVAGAYTFIQEGSQAGQGWVQSGAFTTLGTDAINFVFFNSAGTISGGDMITVSGSVVSVDLAASSGLESTNPGNAAGELRVKVEASNPSLEINGSNELAAKLDAAGAITSGASGLKVGVDDVTVKIASNQLEGLKTKKMTIDPLGSTTITNQYIDLADVAATDSIHFMVLGGYPTLEGYDYTVSYTGGSGGMTRITFAGDLATGGASALVAADVVQIAYSYL